MDMAKQIYHGMKDKTHSIMIGSVEKVYQRTYRADIIIYQNNQYIKKAWIGSDYTGDGFGIVHPIAVGDIVLVAFAGGSIDVPIIIKRLWTENVSPPDTSSGEFLYEHKSGAKIKITADGDIYTTPAAGKKHYIGAESSTKKIALHEDSTAGHDHTINYLLTAPPGGGPITGTITVLSNTDKIVATSENSEAK